MKTNKVCKDCGNETYRTRKYCDVCGRDFVTNTPGLMIDGFEKGIPHKDNRITKKYSEE